MPAGYSKAFMPLDKVKEKEFMSRPMGCKGVGFSFVRCKPGEGATYVHRHKVQEEVFIAFKGDGTIILDGKDQDARGNDSAGRPESLAGAWQRF